MLSRQLAQKIANQIMNDIDYNINVMDEKGQIIASGNSERIGDIHQGAKNVMVSKERNFINEDTETEKKGINDPIFIDGRCVGVVGISGDPEDVLKIKNVVNTLFYFLISREVEMNKQYSEKQRRQKIIRKLVYQEENLTSEDITYLKKNNFNYEADIFIVSIKGKMRPFSEPLFYVENKEGYLTLFIPEQEVNEKGRLEKYLETILFEGYLCGVCKVQKNLSEGYKRSQGTLEVVEILKSKNGIHYYWDHMLFVNALLYTGNNVEELNPGMVVVQQDELLYESLLTFVRKDGRMKETSDALIIHRNTLLYRLNKIKKLTSWDPNTLNGLSNLVFSILISERNNN